MSRFGLGRLFPGLLWVFFWTTTAEAICMPAARQIDQEDSYQYLAALVESFAWAKSGLARVETDRWLVKYETAESIPALIDLLGQHMFAMKLARQDYACAAEMIRHYLESKNAPIQVSAQAAHLTYQRVIELDTQGLTEMEIVADAVASGQGQEEVAAFLRHSTDRQAAQSEAWNSFFLPVAPAATHALVRLSEDPAQPTSGLTITTSQRKSLLRAIENVFGDSVKGGPRKGRSALEGAAWVIHQFLSSEKWKSRDSD